MRFSAVRRRPTPAWDPADSRGRDGWGPLREKNSRERGSRTVHVVLSLMRRLLRGRDVARETHHDLVRLQRVGTPLLGNRERPSGAAIAVCSCDLWLIAATDDAALHAHDRHQAEPGEVWSA